MKVVAKKGSAVVRSSSQTPPMRGLGDLVAKFAEPIAEKLHIDKEKCGCLKRREWLNQKVPFHTPPEA